MVIDIELTLNRFGFRKISENKFQLFCFRFSKWEIPKDRKSTRLNSSHSQISYAVFCLKKKKVTDQNGETLPFAVVILQQHDTTLFHERPTPSGTAVLRQLAPGAYKVLIEKQGFYSATF